MNPLIRSLCLIFLTFLHSVTTQQNYNAAFERTEYVDGTKQTLVDFSKVRVIRNKNRDYCLNGTMTVVKDLGEKYMAGVEFYNSPMGNSGFIKMPYEIQKIPMCQYLREFFEKYLRPSLDGHTDIPVPPLNGPCVKPKGEWHISCATPVLDNYPSHIPRGLIKTVTTFYDENSEIIGGMVIFFRITDRLNYHGN